MSLARLANDEPCATVGSGTKRCGPLIRSKPSIAFSQTFERFASAKHLRFHSRANQFFVPKRVFTRSVHMLRREQRQE
jgi:hypothetical protein